MVKKISEAKVEYEEYKEEYCKAKEEKEEKRKAMEFKAINKDLKEDDLGLISVKKAIR